MYIVNKIINISVLMASQYKWDKARIDYMRGGQDSSEQITLENPWDGCFQIFLEHTAYRDMTLLVKCNGSQHEEWQGSML